MRIETHTPEIESERKTLLRLLARQYPASAVRDFPDKEFHRLLHRYDLLDALEKDEPRDSFRDWSHPYIDVDMRRCIYCYRCARICEEVQGQFVWKVWNRGDETRILPDSQTTLLESSCVSCGACIDTCPTGALEDHRALSISEWTKTTCPYCGTGCEMNAGSAGDRLVSIRPAMDAPVSRGHLCVKGRYAFEFVHARDRITAPMIKENGQWKNVSWNEALAFTADKLKRILEEHGPQSVAVLGSARATNEENYLAQKFARVVLETNNVDCCARVCHAPTAAAMKMMLGTGAATNSFADIEQAHSFLLCGANPTENHPIVGARIKQAVIGGARLALIDPQRIELADYADCHIQLRPGTNIPLLNAMAAAIIEEKLYDETFIARRVLEWEEFCAFIKDYAPEKVARVCGVDSEIIRQAARIYALEKPAMSFHGLGVTEHVQGTEGVMCIVNLALITGNIGRAGAGVNPLRGQNNVQGAAHMGCDPGTLTGGVAISDGRDAFEQVWGVGLPTGKGLNMLEMMDAAEEGKLKALWAIGYDIFLSNANANATRRALGSIDLLVVQDMFLNETAREFAHVFFPAASSFEKDGTFMNAERRVQRIRKAITPRGESKSDLEIICLLARAMGRGEFFQFDSARSVWNEIRAVWKAGSGISYERIESAGLQWPCPEEDHPGTEILHTESFPIGERAALRRIHYRPTPEVVSREFPFLLTTGRTLYQFNAGTMTLRTPNIALRRVDSLDLSAEDAQALGIIDGERVRLRSRYGETILPARITRRVKRGEMFATFHSPDVFLNFVTSPHRDRFVKAPEYKVTAVRIEKL